MLNYTEVSFFVTKMGMFIYYI